MNYKRKFPVSLRWWNVHSNVFNVKGEDVRKLRFLEIRVRCDDHFATAYGDCQAQAWGWSCFGSQHSCAVRCRTTRTTQHRSFFFEHDVADASHGALKLRFKATVYLAAELTYVYVNYVSDAAEALVPNVLDDHVAGDHASRVAHQVFEQSILLRA